MTSFDMMNSPQGPDPKRLLLAVVATSAVLLVYSYFFAPVQPLPVAQVEQAEAVQKIALPPVEKAPELPTMAHAQATPTTIPITSISFEVDEKPHQTNPERASYRAEITNRGGVIERFALTDFSHETVIFDDKALGSSLLRISSESPELSFDEKSPYEIVAQDKNKILLRHVSNFGLAIEREYQFLEKATIKEKITFKNLATAPLRVSPKFSAIKRDVEVKEPSFMNPGVQGQNIAVKTEGKYERFTYADIKDQSKEISSAKYLAFDDQFFLAAILPDYQEAIGQVNIVVKEEEKHGKVANIAITLKPFVLLAGEEKSLSHQFFIGPKQIDLLSSLTYPLDENVDFGWFGVLSRPMLWLLVQIYGFVKNYGLAIILITIVIKLLTYPLTQKSFTSQQQMKKLQPKIKELQQKFGHDRTALGQKQMELYREHGVNPVAGCLPILIQLPIWIAFFQMLRNSVELFDQPFYWWIRDLTLPDQYFVMPILMGVTMLIQQAFTPPPAEQPQMKYVMWTMPIFLTFIMLNMPSGLSLYMLTNNLLTILQQIIIKGQSGKANA